MSKIGLCFKTIFCGLNPYFNGVLCPLSLKSDLNIDHVTN